MIGLSWARGWSSCVALAAAVLLPGCGSDSDSTIDVEFDGSQFPASTSHANFYAPNGAAFLAVTATDPGSDAIDDEEWFTLTVDPGDASFDTGVLRLDGTWTLTDTVDGPNGYPQEEDLGFAPGPTHDPRIARVWLFRHAWFHSWEGDQQQTLSGELEVLELLANGQIRGRVDVRAEGSFPPVSPGSEHAGRMIGSFETEAP